MEPNVLMRCCHLQNITPQRINALLTVKELMKSAQRSSRKCTLHNVLYIPELSYNLLSVSKAVECRNIVKFGSSSCIIRDSNRKLITVAQNVGGLYHINTTAAYINSVWTTSCREITKEDVWHRRFGQLNIKSLQKLTKDNLVDGFDFSYM